jgi:hypothetical protein
LIGRVIKYFRHAHNRCLNTSHKHLLRHYQDNYSNSSPFSQEFLGDQGIMSSQHINQQQFTGGSLKDDPMKKYDNVAPELGVGYERWVAIRKAWQTGCKGPSSTIPPKPKKKKYDKCVDVDSIVEHLVNPRKPAFKHPVPLSEMITVCLSLLITHGIDKCGF